MTYENAVQWCIDHIDTEGLESYSDWYSKCYEKMGGGNIFNNTRFNQLLENYWLGEYGRFDLEPPQRGFDTPESRAIDIGAITPPKEESKPSVVILPQTGNAPTIPKPTLVFPENTPKSEKKGLLSRLRGFFRRKK